MAMSSIGTSVPRTYVAPRAAAPAQPTGGSYYPPVQTQAAPSGLSLGKLAAWAGGAIGFRSLWNNVFRDPRGWGLVAVLGAGAFAGNWLYNKLTGRG